MTLITTVKSHGSSAGLSGSYESTEPGSSRPMQFSSSYDNQNAANMMHKVPAGKALDHEGGFLNVIPNASKAVQVWLIITFSPVFFCVVFLF